MANKDIKRRTTMGDIYAVKGKGEPVERFGELESPQK
jgi:hypothetical protein